MVMFNTDCPFTGTSRVANPTEEKMSIASEGAVIENFPSVSVTTPLDAFLITTFTEGRFLPFGSVTLPLMTCCANRIDGKIVSTDKQSIRR
jgi:hypothetical protein